MVSPILNESDAQTKLKEPQAPSIERINKRFNSNTLFIGNISIATPAVAAEKLFSDMECEFSIGDWKHLIFLLTVPQGAVREIFPFY